MQCSSLFCPKENEDLDDSLQHKVQKLFVVALENQISGAAVINFDDNGTTAKTSWDFIHPFIQVIYLVGKVLRHRLDLLKASKEVEKIALRTYN
jgi:hypothetical protein